MKRLLICLLAFCLVVFPVWAHAGWLDDWFSQYVSSSPDYFEGQKRGFISAGSFSARWYSGGSQPLLSIELPRFRTGCGGIDAFLGGMSFAMLPEYLVQKVQALIAAAPAIAFEVALSILSEKLSDKSDTIQKIIDVLNSIQIDECQIVKGVKVAATKLVQGETLAEAWTAFKQESGLDDLWHEATKKIKDKQVTSSDIQEMTKGCPSDLKSLANAGSLVRWALSQAGFSDPEGLARYVRAVLGDVIAKNGKFVYQEPCPQVRAGADGEVNALLGQARYVMDESGRCYVDSSPIRIGGSSYQSIEHWAQENLVKLADDIKRRRQLDSQAAAFARVIPASLYQAVKTAVLSDNYSGSLATYARFAGAAVTYRILNTVYGSGLYAVALVDRVFTSKAVQKEDCQAQVFQNFIDAARTFLDHAGLVIASAKQRYQNEMYEMYVSLSHAVANQEMLNKVLKNIAEALAGGKTS